MQSDDGNSNESAAAPGEEEYDDLESVHLEFFPARGLLAPGATVQVRLDLHAGARPVVLQRSVGVRVAVAPEGELEAQEGEASFTARGGWEVFFGVHGGGFATGAGTGTTTATGTRGSTASSSLGLGLGASSFGETGALSQLQQQQQQAQVFDEYGYNRTPSATLGSRTPISSSTPAPGRLPGRGGSGGGGGGGVHVDPRSGRPVTSLVGVGHGFAGMDVRVDYPAPPALPLNVSSLARRTAALRIGDAAQQKLQDEEGRATAHLAPTMASLQSVPARATWFSDASLPIQQIAQAAAANIQMIVQARVLDAGLLEQQQRLRQKHFAAQQQVQQRLPQQQLTEITNPDSTVAQRYFVPQPDPSVDGGGEEHAAAGVNHLVGGGESKVPANATAAAVVETALLGLLRQALGQSDVDASFAHLRTQPIPYFADLLAGQSPASLAAAATAASTAAAASDAPPTSASSASSLLSSPSAPAAPVVALQNLSESILNDTLFHLLVEAHQPAASGWNIEETPRLFVQQPPQGNGRHG
jgi:hypothetical protein